MCYYPDGSIPEARKSILNVVQLLREREQWAFFGFEFIARHLPFPVRCHSLKEYIEIGADIRLSALCFDVFEFV